MSKFHRLTNNESDFPHIGNVDVYQYDNDFDYSRYDARQMALQVCTVPWDMGEAHIGARTISGIGNVVFFDTPEKRDEWFAAIPDGECYRFTTKYKELHRDYVIDIPVPYDMAARHNYLVVHYEPFANSESFVEYETANGKNDWFWFIREVEFIAPNTTRLHLMEDAWQTWIYDIEVTGMILERGHAPLHAVDIEEYLENPIDNSEYLLCEDVNYGRELVSKHSSEYVFNADEMLAVFITTSDISSAWGNKSDSDWKTPGYENCTLQGVPAYFAFAVRTENLNSFLSNVSASYPQFVQTIKAIAFVSERMVTLGEAISFAGTSCYTLNADYKHHELMKLQKNDFGYDAPYCDIAKLYTYPYAYIEICDEQGNVTEIHIETTNGKIGFDSCVSLVFPWLTINGHLSGIGKSNSKSLTFSNITKRNMPIQGNWYEYLMSWDIPTFGIIQDAATNNDYATFYDRKQQQTAIDNQYLNVQESADTLLDNADLQIIANDAITSTSNTASQTDTDAVQSFNIATQAWQAGASRASANNQIVAAEQSAAIAVGSGIIGQMAQGAASGGAIGAVGGLIGGVVGGIATGLQTTVSTNLTDVQTETQISFAASQLVETNQNSEDRIAIQIDASSDNNDTQNDYIEASTANTAAMQLANAARDKATGESAIANQIAQAAIGQPSEFGAFDKGGLATSRPMGLFTNIVTQSDYAIKRAGDEFLRYGYMYDGQWSFDGNWCVMKHFTYWKLKDFWVRGLNVPDMYMDRLRFFLYGGVTIWKKPEDIGKISIYENL